MQEAVHLLGARIKEIGNIEPDNIPVFKIKKVRL